MQHGDFPPWLPCKEWLQFCPQALSPPEQGLLQHQLILPWLQSLWGRVVRSSSPRGRGYSEKLEHDTAEKWTGEFLLPTELPAFWGPTIFPASTALLPFPKWCFPASSWKRALTGHEHTQGLE